MHLAFDFDGTICKSLPVYLEIARKYCLENNLVPVSPATARQIGLKGLIKHYHLTPLQIAKIIFWGRPQLAYAYPTLPLIPGMASVLEKLSQKHTLGLVTSTDLKSVLSNLQHHNIDHLFSYIDAGVDLFGKNHKLNKLKPDYYIGDETRDIEAATKAGCKSIAVTWGFESETLLATSHPTFLVPTPAKLYATLSFKAA
jgi:phosphoglycolate phosphatase